MQFSNLLGAARVLEAGRGLIAITRSVSPAIDRCVVTHIHRSPIDYHRAREQHSAYETALKGMQLTVISLPPQPELPDSVFVEDCAIVLDECAVITRPGDDSRKPEVETIAKAISPYRLLHQIEAPGTIDGGDVIVAGHQIYVGLTARSNMHGIRQMQKILDPYGYTVHTVSVQGCLHLKTAATLVGPNTLLVNPVWVDTTDFGPNFQIIQVDPSEPNAANAVKLQGDVVLYPEGFPKTVDILRAHGFLPILVPADELAKAEGACAFQGYTPGKLIMDPKVIAAYEEIASGHLKLAEYYSSLAQSGSTSGVASVPAEAVVPSPRATKAPKDPNAPKRPPSSFLLFSNDMRAKIKEEHPDMKFADVTMELARLWKEADHTPYEQKSKDLSAAYMIEKTKYMSTKRSPAEVDQVVSPKPKKAKKEKKAVEITIPSSQVEAPEVEAPVVETKTEELAKIEEVPKAKDPAMSAQEAQSLEKKKKKKNKHPEGTESDKPKDSEHKKEKKHKESKEKPQTA